MHVTIDAAGCIQLEQLMPRLYVLCPFRSRFLLSKPACVNVVTVVHFDKTEIDVVIRKYGVPWHLLMMITIVLADLYSRR